MINTLLKIDTEPTMMTKEKALAVMEANNGGEDIYVVRQFNEKQGLFVVDVIEDGEVVFTL